MPTLLQFSKNIRKRGNQIENETANVVRRVARRALRTLVLGTRVDTGLARSNWRVSLGGFPKAVIPPYAPGSKLGITERGNALGALTVGNAIISGLTGRGHARKSIVIVNHVRYIDFATLPGVVSGAAIEAAVEIRNFRLVQ